MNIAAYCRVSTDKEDQLNSLETQKKFFQEYTERSGNRLVRLYADEGISGTKTKNRKQFLKMMSDAELGMFDILVVKDISRFARNTVDLLENIRKLKKYGIQTYFPNSNMTSMGDSEFLLTIFGAIAQEESCNTSKRVKFGKRINAEKGRVPNIIYGYNKTKGDYFNLTINQNEASIVRRIYSWYINEGYGAGKIAMMLNDMGLKTKRNCNWTQNAICRILDNEIYTGKIINGKEEVSDFLTGKRKLKSEDQWFIVEKPELRIIDDASYMQAQNVKKERGMKFKVDRERHSNLHLFSTLIKCKDCGASFRRCVRSYKNTYIRWVCSGHNGKGADSCPNAITVDENELIKVIENYFTSMISNRKQLTYYIVGEFQKLYRTENENEAYKKELQQKIKRINRNRKKYMDMYTDDLITRKELNDKISWDKQVLESLEEELKTVEQHITKSSQLQCILTETFKDIENVSDLSRATNAQLRHLLDRIEVDHQGNVEIFLR